MEKMKFSDVTVGSRISVAGKSMEKMNICTEQFIHNCKSLRGEWHRISLDEIVTVEELPPEK